MTGLEVSRVQAEQKTTTVRKQQPKQENIIIKFSDLPANMRTKQVREFYDKDNSGFLESNNENGQNEVALMQQAFGLDLSKYKSDITKTKKEENVYTGYNNNGDKIVEIKDLQGLIQ